MFDALVLQWRVSLDYTEVHTVPHRQSFFRVSINQDRNKRSTIRSAQNTVLLKCLNDLNDIRQWVLSLHFGSLTDFVQEMGQCSLVLRSDTLTSVNASGLFVYIWSTSVADPGVILDGDSISLVRPSSVIFESQEECGFSKSILKYPNKRMSA